jgi:hypothetical protein
MDIDDRARTESDSPEGLHRRRFITRGGTVAAAVAGAVAATAIGASPAGAQSVSAPVFLPVGPFRVYDSRRDPRGRIRDGQTRRLVGGVEPGDFAQLFNLTITGTTSSGYLALFPGDAPYNGTSSVNWFGSNQTLCNNAYSGFDLADGGINIRCGGGTTHFVLDLVGVLTVIDLSAVGAARVGAASVDGPDSGSSTSLTGHTEASARRTAAG